MPKMFEKKMNETLWWERSLKGQIIQGLVKSWEKYLRKRATLRSAFPKPSQDPVWMVDDMRVVMETSQEAAEESM